MTYEVGQQVILINDRMPGLGSGFSHRNGFYKGRVYTISRLRKEVFVYLDGSKYYFRADQIQPVYTVDQWNID